MAAADSNAANRDTVVGVFHNHAEAQQAVRRLKEAGFTEEQIGVAARDHETKDVEHEEKGNKAAEGATAGAVAGLGAGALWGLGIVAGLLPAIGPVIAGGTLAAIAASAAGTAAAGGLLGALIGAGIPEEEAEYYEQQFNDGRTIVTVKAGAARHDEARRILDGANAYDYDRRESDYASNAQAAERVDAGGKLVARKEVLDVDKHQRQAGEAVVRKEVTTETQHVEVPVRKEELVVERTDLHGKAAAPITGDTTEQERVTLKEEVVDVDKRTVAKEQVEVGKRVVEDREQVDAKLKEEHIEVDAETHTTERPKP
jgi:uncharacterized protein (TIGR02271 family)